MLMCNTQNNVHFMAQNLSVITLQSDQKTRTNYYLYDNHKLIRGNHFMFNVNTAEI